MLIVKCSNCGAKNRVDEQKLQQNQAKCGRCGDQLDAKNVVSEPAAATPLIVTDNNFQQVLQQAGNRPLLIDCWAEWCGPCRRIGPIVDQLATESAGKYVIGKLNVDENPLTASRFSIRSIPSLLIFKNGQLVDRLVGAQPKQAIAEHLARAA